jgi:type I site-specific restriction endonuclease|tara:strand:+ start:258 stop:554 length:297 start_codon:yes stop_codon:yes gene_type:complete
MTNIVITKNSTYEERMDAIRAVSAKRKKSAEIRARLKVGASRVRRFVDEEDKPQRKKFDDMIDKMDENHNHYQDAPQYAEKYYGEKMRDTVAMDNDWN